MKANPANGGMDLSFLPVCAIHRLEMSSDKDGFVAYFLVAPHFEPNLSEAYSVSRL